MDTIDLIEQGKIKRVFRARKKLSYPGATSHITQRAPGKEPLFLEEGDYLYMLHLIKDAVKKFKLDLFSFVLMMNHVHLLLRQVSDNLSISMKNLFERYANYFNKKYERKGHVFCGAFRQALCLDDSYLLAASLYIHLNPVRAGLCANPIDYRWSSIIPYIRPVSKETFVNYKFILRMLDEDLAQARKEYRELLARASEVKIENVLEGSAGLGKFRRAILEFIPDTRKRDMAWRISGEAIDREVAALREKKRFRRPSDVKARKFLIDQLRARGYTIGEIAARLGISRRGLHKALSSQNK